MYPNVCRGLVLVNKGIYMQTYFFPGKIKNINGGLSLAGGTRVVRKEVLISSVSAFSNYKNSLFILVTACSLNFAFWFVFF